MGWFDEQIRQRKQKDDEVFAESFVHLAGSVMGKKMQAALSDDRQLAKDALAEILKYYHVKSREIPEGMEDIREQMEYLLRPHGIMYRTVILSKGWRRDAAGAMLGTRKADGSIVALIPDKIQGYRYLDRGTGKIVAVNRKTEEQIEPEAVCFYKPFPLKKISFGALYRFIFETLSVWDILLFGLAVIGATLLGMLTPKLNHIIFSVIITEGSLRLVLAMAVFMICVSFSGILIGGVKELLMSRIRIKMNLAVEAAVMMRVFSLPASFFKTSSAGELSSRTNYVGGLCNMLASVVFGAGLSCVFSLAYFLQIFTYTTALAVPAMGIILATTLFFRGVRFCADGDQQEADGAVRKGKQHELRHDIGNSEDQAVRCGKKGFCKMGKAVCRERRFPVQSACVFKIKHGDRYGAHPCRKYHFKL